MSSVDRDFTATGPSKVLGDLANPSSFLLLSRNNYPLWVMQMQVASGAHGLWEAIEAETVSRKKY